MMLSDRRNSIVALSTFLPHFRGGGDLVAPRCSIGQRFYVWDKRLIRRINEFIGNKCIYSRGFIRSYERVAMKLLFSCNEVQRKCVNFHWNK